MIKNKIITFIILISITTPLLVSAAIPILQSGAEVQEDLDRSAEREGFTTYSQNEMMLVRMNAINTIISYILGFIGIIFLINMIIGGFKWMTAGGNEEKITNAKHTVNNSILALIIVLGAYVIANLIMQLLSLF